MAGGLAGLNGVGGAHQRFTSVWALLAAAIGCAVLYFASSSSSMKLAAAIGAWLPLEAIPLCFGLATSGALVMVMLARLSGQAVMRTTRIPFGAFLCPALWIVFFADSVTR